jgi:hypothetical protein
METVADWREYLGAGPDSPEEIAVMKSTLTGRPCGGEDFTRSVEEHLGRHLTPQPRGRPRRSEK